MGESSRPQTNYSFRIAIDHLFDRGAKGDGKEKRDDG
jgi:hypothetical protein